MSAAGRKDRVAVFRGLILALTGLVIAAFVAVSVLGTRELVQTGQRAQGRVVELAAGTSHPTIEFEDTAGRTIQFAGNGFVSHQRGDKVRVLFDERDPDTSAVLDEPGALWFFDAATGLLGAAMIALGIFSATRRKSPQGAIA